LNIPAERTKKFREIMEFCENGNDLNLCFESFDFQSDNSLENLSEGNGEDRLEKIINLSQKQRSEANARERYRTHR
jgi:hypothetical protein